MAEQDVNEVLIDYQNLAESEHHSFLTSLVNNYIFANNVFNVLQLFEERAKVSDMLQPLCDLLYNVYRNSGVEFKQFGLQFLPSLVNIYLINTTSGAEKQNYQSVETFLVGVHNLEISEETNKSKSFRVPSLAQNSIYHDWNQLGDSRHHLHLALPGIEIGMDRGNSTLKVEKAPAVATTAITAQNRIRVIGHLLGVYTALLGDYSKQSLEQCCKVFSRIVIRGFDKFSRNKSHGRQHSYGTEQGVRSPRLPTVRIPLSSQILLEMLQVAYVAIFNGYVRVGLDLVRDIEFRARYETLPTVILVARSVNNVAPLATAAVSQPTIAAPTQLSKNMITNASFRTKKLEGDIPRVEDEEGQTNGDNPRPNAMTVISEEAEEQLTTGDKRQDGKQKDKDSETNIVDKMKGYKEKLENKIPIRKKDKERAVSEGSDKEERSKGGEKKEKSQSKKEKKLNTDFRNSFHQNSTELVPELDKSEEIIRSVPSETTAIHSPESGSTTLY